MSIQHAVSVILNGHYKKENIQNILQKGISKGFIYYDHILGERYEESPVLDAERAAEKVIKALKEDTDGGPSVYTHFDDNNGFLFFYKFEDQLIEFRIGSFGSPIRKDFKDNVYSIDFDHYIRMVLDLCKDFAIIKLETESF